MLDTSSDLELKDRFTQLIGKYIQSLPSLISALESFGKIRKELQLISSELQKRQINVENLEEKAAQINNLEQKLASLKNEETT